MDMKDLRDVAELLQGYIDKHLKTSEVSNSEALVTAIKRHFKTSQEKKAVPIAEKFKNENLSDVIEPRRAVVNSIIDRKLSQSKTEMIERLTEDFVYPPIGSLPITRIGSIYDSTLPLTYNKDYETLELTKTLPAIIHGRYYEIEPTSIRLGKLVAGGRRKYYIYLVLKRGTPSFVVSSTLTNDSYTRTYVGHIIFDNLDLEELKTFCVSKVANFKLPSQTRVNDMFANMYVGVAVSEIINKIELLPDISSAVPIKDSED